MLVPLYKGKEERTKFSNHIGNSLLIVVGKIYAGILVYKVNEVLIDVSEVVSENAGGL